MKYITINKNRGWRGLAEIVILNEDKDLTTKHIFSFSQPMWEDLINHNKTVIADEEHYYVIHFLSVIRGLLPKADQQRSVLIKNFTAEIDQVNKYDRPSWVSSAKAEDWSAIAHFIKNKNNHTTSDWNCIGIRVVPKI